MTKHAGFETFCYAEFEFNVDLDQQFFDAALAVLDS